MAGPTRKPGEEAALSCQPVDDPRNSPQERVRWRLILYVHGFDPRGPGPCYAMQREDMARETARPDRTFTVGPRRRQPGASAWTLNAEWVDGPVEAEFVVLRWDDLVRTRWDRSLLGQMQGLFRWWRMFWAAGYMADAARTSRTLLIAVLTLPVAVFLFGLAMLVLAVMTSALLAELCRAVGLPSWIGLIGLGVVAATPRAWRRLDGRLNLCWLGRGYLHMTELSQGRIAGMEARIDAFADRLLAEADDPRWDEIVVVGHSSGSLHAVPMVGRALTRRPDLGRTGPRLALITVGHCLPGYAMLGPTPAYAADLARLVETRHIPWLDITAPSDPGAGGGWRPLRHSPHAGDETRVICRSPRFHRALDPAAFRRLRRDPMAFHFQYMRSCDHPEVYDWFRLIAGPEPVAA